MNDDDFAELFKSLPGGRSTGTSWADVAAEVDSLAHTFGEVLRRMWRNPELDSDLAELRKLVDSAITGLNQAVDGTPEAKQAREQLTRLSDSLRDTLERAAADMRPELVKLLRQANAELRRHSGLDEENA